MVFPQTALPARFELDLDGSQVYATNITNDVYLRSDVTITRGRPDESSTVEPSQCSLVLDNRTASYSLRNPNGIYFGQLGRNTPLKVSIDSATSWLSINTETGTTPVAGAYVSTPDAAALDIVGDIDIRFDADLDSWSEATELVSKWTTTGNQRSYALVLNATGSLTVWISPDGTATTGSHTSSAKVPITTGRIAVRATIDVNNGAGGHVATFYTADTIAGPWTVLSGGGASAGVVSIFASTAPLRVLDNPDANLAGSIIRGKVYAAQVLSGIAGTAVANPDFTAQAEGATGFTDAAGRVWTLNGTLGLTKKDVRFLGEVSAWPVQWDISGRDVYVPLESAGVLRRMSQGSSPLQSAMYRGAVKLPSLVAYWPMEDAVGSTAMASALDGGRPMGLSGSPSLSTNTDFACSLPLPTLDAFSFSGSVVPYTSTGDIQVRFLMSVPSGGAVNNGVICRIFCSGSATRWDLIYGTGGNLTLSSFGDENNALGTSGLVAFAVNGKKLWVSIQLDGTGSNVNWQIATLEVGRFVGSASSGTLASKSVRKCTKITINPGQNITDTAIGHVYVQKAISGFDLGSQLNAYNGETAGRRIQRLCREEDVEIQGFGNLDDTAAMGPQLPIGLVDLLKECAETDMGVLGESRAVMGISYRPRSSLYNQVPAVTIPYTALADLAPVEDDAQLRNDVTVSRSSGSSARSELDTGRLSVQTPPDGAGRYDTSVSVSTSTDEALPDQASWRVHLGTVDEARYPGILVNLANPAITVALTTALQGLDLGDRIVISNPPAGRTAPGDVSQIFQGVTETLNESTHLMVLKCSPESPWQVANYQAAPSLTGDRYSSDGSVLAEAATSSATSLVVSTPVGPRWTATPAEFPMSLRTGGEAVTASAVSGHTEDTFARTVANGWGSPTIGPLAWTIAGGTASDYSVSGGFGVHSNGVVNTTRRTYLQPSFADVEVLSAFQTAVLATGGNLEFSHMVRITNAAPANDYYYFEVECSTTATIRARILRKNATVDTALTTAFDIPGLTHVINTPIWCRARAIDNGDGTTDLRMNVWTGLRSAEPRHSWTVSVTDTSPLVAGGVGVRSTMDPTNTNALPVVFKVPTYEIVMPQTFTVTRAVNGVSKAQTAGTVFELSPPAYYAL